MFNGYQEYVVVHGALAIHIFLSAGQTVETCPAMSIA
jgi:hypothetical protein